MSQNPNDDSGRAGDVADTVTIDAAISQHENADSWLNDHYDDEYTIDELRQKLEHWRERRARGEGDPPPDSVLLELIEQKQEQNNDD